MEYKNCVIVINKCQQRGWRDWHEYTVSNGQQIIEGRSRGNKSEVVSLIKWQIDHDEMFPVVKQPNTGLQRTGDHGLSAGVDYALQVAEERSGKSPAAKA